MSRFSKAVRDRPWEKKSGVDKMMTLQRLKKSRLVLGTVRFPNTGAVMKSPYASAASRRVTKWSRLFGSSIFSWRDDLPIRQRTRPYSRPCLCTNTQTKRPVYESLPSHTEECTTSLFTSFGQGPRIRESGMTTQTSSRSSVESSMSLPSETEWRDFDLPRKEPCSRTGTNIQLASAKDSSPFSKVKMESMENRMMSLCVFAAFAESMRQDIVLMYATQIRRNPSNAVEIEELDSDTNERHFSIDLGERDYDEGDEEGWPVIPLEPFSRDPTRRLIARQTFDETCPGRDGSFLQRHSFMDWMNVCFSAAMTPQIKADISVEEFRSISRFEKEPFADESGKEVCTMKDGQLEGKTIYIIRSRKPFRLRLTITYADGDTLPTGDIDSISLRMSHGQSVPLDHEARIEGTEIKATVLVNPMVKELEGLTAVCPLSGKVNAKYKETTLKIDFCRKERYSPILTKSFKLHFRIVRANRKLRMRRFAKVLKRKWASQPNAVKLGACLLGNCLCKASECVLL